MRQTSQPEVRYSMIKKFPGRVHVTILSYEMLFQDRPKAIFLIFLLRYHINRNLLLLCFLLLNAIFLAVIPTCRTLWLLILSTAAAGFSVGILDTATNVQLIAIHGKKVT